MTDGQERTAAALREQLDRLIQENPDVAAARILTQSCTCHCGEDAGVVWDGRLVYEAGILELQTRD
ncbi:hypothetical protein AB0D63_43385 [Kitasatospora sp. NPDC048343]|uniref:hypothetical protein n=1 Tax=Kitasatospora sp. NPDC048343 TaxID=3154717 RepID=UPI0033DF04B5